MRVLDDEGHECPANTSGQIFFKNLMGSDFEYHNAPEKTKAAHSTDGYGTLGDIGHVDDDGYVFLSDRKIDMIISGGVNIYPAEIEGVLVMHPAVADVAVFGVPDDECGEEVKAVVEPVEGVEAGDELGRELIDHVREHLAGTSPPERGVQRGAAPHPDREAGEARTSRPILGRLGTHDLIEVTHSGTQNASFSTRVRCQKPGVGPPSDFGCDVGKSIGPVLVDLVLVDLVLVDLVLVDRALRPSRCSRRRTPTRLACLVHEPHRGHTPGHGNDTRLIVRASTTRPTPARSHTEVPHRRAEVMVHVAAPRPTARIDFDGGWVWVRR